MSPCVLAAHSARDAKMSGHEVLDNLEEGSSHPSSNIALKCRTFAMGELARSIFETRKSNITHIISKVKFGLAKV